MKLPQITSKPGFEFIFALSIAAIFIIPSVVMAQTKRNIDIMITNGDTVINGKNIKTLSPAERTQALQDMQRFKGPREKTRITDVIITRPDVAPGQPPMIANDGMAHQYGDYVGGEQVRRPMHLRRMNGDSTTTIYRFRSDDVDVPPVPPVPPVTGMDAEKPRVKMFNLPYTRTDDRGNRAMRFNRRNSQRFSYSNTDANGASTNINYSITEPMDEDMKAEEKNSLAISDIKLVPDFNTGKTMLSFNLPAKASAEVELTNSDGKTLWSEKGTGGSFERSFALPLNGMYKLKIKQGNKTTFKNIMKEE